MGIKLELNISDDKELRAFIKDAIKSEIISIARSEVKGIFASVIKEGYIPDKPEDVERIVREEVCKTVKEILDHGSYQTPSVLKVIAREEVAALLKSKLDHGTLV